MPGDIDYINLGRMIIPLELNYCQCMLELEEYYEVIEHTTELLEKHKGKDMLGWNYEDVFCLLIKHHFRLRDTLHLHTQGRVDKVHVSL